MSRGLLAFAVALLVIPAAQASPAPSTWIWSDAAGEGDLQVLLDALDRLGALHHHLDALGIVTFRADAATARALQNLAGGRIDRDHAVTLHLDESVPAIGADDVKRALGPQPRGPTVLVVDTGIDSLHPDFTAGRNLAANVQPARVDGLPVGTLANAPVVDEAGHGTHVSGIVAGSGASLGQQDELHGRYTGAYSIGRVASYKASSIEAGQEAKVEVTGALEAFEWALDNQAGLDLAIVTNSWGEMGSFDPDEPVAYATKRLYLAGMTVVFSAGNNGQDGPGTLNRYCVAPWVLCVAASDLNGTRQAFSSIGTDDPGKPWDHPDLSAPGLAITSTRPAAPSSSLSILQPPGVHLSRTLYADRSGTSLAAPHVAATAALVLAANPDLSPDQIMETLVATARPSSGSLAEVGAGSLDAQAAYGVALATVGERAAFLAGDAVRYAGAASGDAAHARDAVSVAVQGQAPGPGGLVLAGERLWVATPAGIVLLVVALGAALSGTRLRRA
ncbi:MAG: S8 family serine peptidase [Candidatus Thermoplasmatota archaeon]